MTTSLEHIRESASRTWNAAFAGAIAITSRMPGSRQLLTGIDASNYAHVKWHVARQHADDIAHWVTFEADEQADSESGKIPKQYRSVGILAVEANQLDDLAQSANEKGIAAVHALAFRIGSSALVGVMDARTLFGRSETGDEYLIGLRVGQDQLDATAGLWLPDVRQLVVPETGISSRGTMALEQVPVDVPIN